MNDVTRKIHISLIGLILATTALATTALPARAQTEAIAQAKHDLELGFAVGGRVAEVHVAEGDRVKQGQVLMTLEDAQGEALIDLWRQRAESELQVRVQAKRHELARMEAERLADLLSKEAAAPFEARRAAVTAELEALRLDQAHEEHAQAQTQLRQAEARHAQYVLRAPTDGLIERIGFDTGETVEQLQPVVRLVRVDELRVEAAVALDQTLGLAVGDPAWVSFQMAGQSIKPVQGRVTHIAAVADAASDTRRTTVAFTNPGGLPAGCRVTVRFDSPSASR